MLMTDREKAQKKENLQGNHIRVLNPIKATSLPFDIQASLHFSTYVAIDSLMAGVKRKSQQMTSEKDPRTTSPLISIFEVVRSELDEHHDRRERIVKASRDVTAQSKKM